MADVPHDAAFSKVETFIMPIDSDFYLKILMTSLTAGLPIINTDTAARICAVIMVHGNNEQFIYSPKLRAELKYIQIRFHLHGCGVPPPDFVRLLQQYVKELETFEKKNPKLRYCPWARQLFVDRYGIVLIN